MVGFLGGFSVWTGLAAFVVQLFVASKIISRFGLTTALTLFPAAAALGAGLSLLTGGSLLFMGRYPCRRPTFGRTITDTAMNLLYLPVPPDLRRQAKELLGGLRCSLWLVGHRAADQPDGGRVARPVLVDPAAVAGVDLARLTYLDATAIRQHPQCQSTRAQHRSPEHPAGSARSGHDCHTGRRVRGPEALTVLHALSLLDQAPEVEWEPYVAPLLQHPSPDVRVAALRHLGRSGNRTVRPGCRVAPKMQRRRSAVLLSAPTARKWTRCPGPRGTLPER